jgi:hypothetical protein
LNAATFIMNLPRNLGNLCGIVAADLAVRATLRRKSFAAPLDKPRGVCTIELIQVEMLLEVEGSRFAAQKPAAKPTTTRH